MKTRTVISTVEEFHTLIREHWDGHYVYRGEGNSKYQLRSQFGRDAIRNYHNDNTLETSYFNEFKRNALPYLERHPQDNWDWIAIAQHHGLHTRLLDWTKNPLAAAYFAVRNPRGEDAVIYIFNNKDLPRADLSVDPYQITKDQLFYPNHISKRISAQDGLFTIHQKPENIFSCPSLERIIIKAECQIDLLVTLDIYNVNEFSLFPDLNGLAHKLTSNYIWPSTDPHAPTKM